MDCFVFQVQLPERFVIYEVSQDDPNDMKYKVKEKFSKKIECYSLVVCAQHIVLCLVSLLSVFIFICLLIFLDLHRSIIGRHVKMKIIQQIYLGQVEIEYLSCQTGR